MDVSASTSGTSTCINFIFYEKMSTNNRHREVAYDEAIQNLVSMFPYIEQTIIETILELNRKLGIPYLTSEPIVLGAPRSSFPSVRGLVYSIPFLISFVFFFLFL